MAADGNDAHSGEIDTPFAEPVLIIGRAPAFASTAWAIGRLATRWHRQQDPSQSHSLTLLDDFLNCGKSEFSTIGSAFTHDSRLLSGKPDRRRATANFSWAIPNYLNAPLTEPLGLITVVQCSLAAPCGQYYIIHKPQA